LLLEDVGEKPYSVDRMLTSLSLRGAFRGVQAVAFGSFARSGGKRQVREALMDFAEKFGGPVLLGAPFGHGAQNLPWFYGEEAAVQSGPGGGALVFTGAGK
jgi:muramoyltetrapeptide carboxypeptidase